MSKDSQWSFYATAQYPKSEKLGKLKTIVNVLKKSYRDAKKEPAVEKNVDLSTLR